MADFFKKRIYWHFSFFEISFEIWNIFFRKKITLDDNYLFKVSQEVENKSPERIELYDISEGKEVLISYKNIPKEDSSANPEIKMFSIPLTSKNISKIKLIVKSNKNLPKGHVAQGEYAWLFVSEIIGLL